MASKYDLLDNLYKAVDAYCEASIEAGKQKRPLPESYWQNVVNAWQAAKKHIEPWEFED